jgi:nitrate/TMAO reductase-like tetraheme cytochrome c subunit
MNDQPPISSPGAPPGDGQAPIPPPLSRNIVSYLGWAITLTVGVVLAILVAVDLLMHRENPYNSMVTYLILPAFLIGGVAIILLGIGLEWRRRHRHAPGDYPKLPLIDLNRPWQRRRLLLGVVLFSVLFTFSSVGVYQAYHFTESPTFCGRICHQVMKPEFTAYQHSPHARVSCVECHIGPGAEWYVKAKLTGLHQIYAVLFETYDLPIETPVHNLRPAQGTCEQCHWPDKFMDSVEKVVWHFSPNEVNTPVRFNLLLKIGGGSSEMGLGKGIHWHISPNVEVRYWARDEQRLDIPWIEVRRGDRPPVVYKSPDCPDPLPADAAIRKMDCIDCHNRPSHIYRSPHQLIDTSMANGTLDRSLPFFKRYANSLLERTYPDTETALTTIRDELQRNYASWMQGDQGRRVVQNNIEWLQTLYQQNFFPEQKVDWRVYPNHRGHFEWPGCYRCHDGKHVNEATGTPVSQDCRLCHEILDQAEGEAAFEPIAYRGGEFRHPRNLGDIWKGRNCTDCHGLRPGEGAQRRSADSAGGGPERISMAPGEH